MIIDRATIVPPHDVGQLAWSRLRRYHHVPSLTNTIIELHRLSNKERGNATKQANQIRQCLIQAREYRDASSAVTLVTRPTLLYYSAMMLALVQVLFKGDGNSSLDRSRQQHSHHGLIFSLEKSTVGEYELEKSASLLRAKPAFANGARFGTFELWQELSREYPVTSQHKVLNAQLRSSEIENPAIQLVGRDERLGSLPKQGMTLFDCFMGSPGMAEHLRSLNVYSDIVRANLETAASASGSTVFRLIIHPHKEERIDQLKNDIKIHADDHEVVSVKDFASGFALDLCYPKVGDARIILPQATMWTDRDIRFLPSKSSLNEYGYLYVGLHILGNYARYYPDYWIQDVESGSPLAVAAESFLNVAETRIALLTLSDLSRTLHIVGSS